MQSHALREGVTFQHGATMNADDVKLALHRTSAEENAKAQEGAICSDI